MPYSNTIGATPTALTSIAIYLASTSAKSHEDYELTPMQVLGAQSVQDFIAYAQESFRRNAGKGVGRPPKNAGTWIVVRTPDGAFLEPQEMAAYETAARDAAGHGGPVVGILNWHKNKHTGAADLNLLSAAFTESGQRNRDRDRDPVRNLRWRMDQVTDALNALRKTRGIPVITTMREVQKRQARELGITELTEELARIPRPPRTAEELEPALMTLNGKATRRTSTSISVLMPGRRKPIKVSISKLLAEVAFEAKRLAIRKDIKGLEAKNRRGVAHPPEGLGGIAPLAAPAAPKAPAESPTKPGQAAKPTKGSDTPSGAKLA